MQNSNLFHLIYSTLCFIPKESSGTELWIFIFQFMNIYFFRPVQVFETVLSGRKHKYSLGRHINYTNYFQLQQILNKYFQLAIYFKRARIYFKRAKIYFKRVKIYFKDVEEYSGHPNSKKCCTIFICLPSSRDTVKKNLTETMPRSIFSFGQIIVRYFGLIDN